MSIFYVNPTRTAERILRSLPAVAHAAVQCRWPNRVSIQIEERGARYAWETAGGQFLLDGQGRVVRLDDGSGEGLVLIRDLDREPVQIGDDVDQAPLRTAAQLRLLLPQVQSLEYSRDKGLSFVEEHGWRVFVGDDQDLQQKVATFRTVVQHLEARGASARFIDVRYEGCAHYE
jgi:cell division septal protein FtsQ